MTSEDRAGSAYRVEDNPFARRIADERAAKDAAQRRADERWEAAFEEGEATLARLRQAAAPVEVQLHDARRRAALADARLHVLAVRLKCGETWRQLTDVVWTSDGWSRGSSSMWQRHETLEGCLLSCGSLASDLDAVQVAEVLRVKEEEEKALARTSAPDEAEGALARHVDFVQRRPIAASLAASLVAVTTYHAVKALVLLAVGS